MEAFADLADLPEDTRIDIIGRVVTEQMKTVGFFVDDDEKADRYIEKLTKNFALRVLERKRDVLVKNTVFVRVGPITN